MQTQLKFISSLVITGMLLVPSLCANSLWMRSGNREASMFSDPTAFKRGDLVTIIVEESTSMKNSVSTSTEKNSSMASQISNILFDEVFRREGDHPAANMTIGNTHGGSGVIDNSASMTTRITVTVIDVLPNENLVLEGVRHISYSKENYYVVTRGICRKSDLSRNNTISSNFVADASINVYSEGSLTDAQKKGWLLRMADEFSP